MRNITKIAKTFIIISIATIFIKKWSLYIIPLKISDLFLFFGFILTIILIFKKEIIISTKMRMIIKYMATIFTILITGTMISLIFFNADISKNILISYMRIISCMLLFLEIMIFGENDNIFIKNIILSFIFSFIVIPMAYLFPTLIENGLLLDSSKYRFAGLFNDPNYWSNFSIFPAITILYLFSKEKKKIIKIILFILLSLIFGFFIYTGSRSGWIGLLISILIFIIYFLKINGFKKMIFLLFFIGFSLSLGILITPKQIQKQSIDRIVEIIGKNNLQRNKENINKKNNVIIAVESVKKQDRVYIWIQSLDYFKKNPIGYGPNYSEIINIENNGQHRATHNILIEMMLIGGIPLLTIFIFILIKNKNYSNISTNRNYFLLSAIAGTLASSLFIDSFESRWIWVMFAILLVSLNYKNNLLEI